MYEYGRKLYKKIQLSQLTFTSKHTKIGFLFYQLALIHNLKVLLSFTEQFEIIIKSILKIRWFAYFGSLFSYASNAYFI